MVPSNAACRGRLSPLLPCALFAFRSKLRSSVVLTTRISLDTISPRVKHNTQLLQASSSFVCLGLYGLLLFNMGRRSRARNTTDQARHGAGGCMTGNARRDQSNTFSALTSNDQEGKKPLLTLADLVVEQLTLYLPLSIATIARTLPHVQRSSCLQ